MFGEGPFDILVLRSWHSNIEHEWAEPGTGRHLPTARVWAGEILVTSTVRDPVAGSGIGFSDHGQHALKGVPEAR